MRSFLFFATQFCEVGGDLGFVAGVGGLVVLVAAYRFGQVVLADVVAGEVVRVLVAGAPTQLLGERRGRVANVVRDGQRAVGVDVLLHGRVGRDRGVGLGRARQVDGGLGHRDDPFRQYDAAERGRAEEGRGGEA